jgi:hypothetical protein
MGKNLRLPILRDLERNMLLGKEAMGKQEPGIQLAHLIFYWNKKCFGHSAFYLTSVYFFSLPTEANLAYKAIGLDSNPARIPAEHQKVGTRVRIPGQLLLSTVRPASMVAAGIGNQ